VGVVKEAEKPDTPAEELLGVEEFESGYFCGPLYQDTNRGFYEHLGDQKIFTLGTLGKALLNPLKTRAELKALGERLKAKSIDGNMRGDGLVKGGVLVISADDEIVHTFYEDAGQGIPADDAEQIVRAAKKLARPSAALG